MECDKLGQVLWMNQGARERFGARRNLLEGLPEESATAARRVLAGEADGNEIHLESYQLPNLPSPVAVSFARVLAHDDRVWLTAQVGKPAPEPVPAAVGELRDVQDSVVDHYFRLQKLGEKIEGFRKRRFDLGGNAVRLLEDERMRLGRELHAGVGQALAGIRVHLEIVHTHIPSPPDLARGSLERIGVLAEEALEQVRAVSHRLHPPEWERLTIHEALRQLWDLSGLPQRYEASLELPPRALRLEPNPKALIYRMAQEAISNLIRHSGATRVRLALTEAPGLLVCTVEDNGKGFDARRQWAAPASVVAGVGLRSIRDQAASLGGGFFVESSSQGTTLKLTLPYAEPRQEDGCQTQALPR
jgi:signal transduction histidine kinase